MSLIFGPVQLWIIGIWDIGSSILLKRTCSWVMSPCQPHPPRIPTTCFSFSLSFPLPKTTLPDPRPQESGRRSVGRSALSDGQVVGDGRRKRKELVEAIGHDQKRRCLGVKLNKLFLSQSARVVGFFLGGG